MDWLTHNWWWIVILVLVVIYWLSQRKTETGGQVTDSRAAAIVRELINAFDTILIDFLPTHYTSEHRRKIATGMVVVMAYKKITLEQMKNNPKLVIDIAAESCAILVKEGMIPSPF